MVVTGRPEVTFVMRSKALDESTATFGADGPEGWSYAEAFEWMIGIVPTRVQTKE
jgi:hypothetical protein